MLSNAKKILLYLCLDSRKRFLTDPVFTKSRNNWFPTCSVYPLSCSPRLSLSPSYRGSSAALHPCVPAPYPPPPATVPALREKGHLATSRDWPLCEPEAGPGGKLPPPSCQVGVVVFLPMQEKELCHSVGAPCIALHRKHPRLYCRAF